MTEEFTKQQCSNQEMSPTTKFELKIDNIINIILKLQIKEFLKIEKKNFKDLGNRHWA